MIQNYYPCLVFLICLTWGYIYLLQATLVDLRGTDVQPVFRSIVCYTVGNGESIVLCRLQPTRKSYQCSLNLELEESEDVVFSLDGYRPIHLAGYFIRPPMTTINTTTTCSCKAYPYYYYYFCCCCCRVLINFTCTYLTWKFLLYFCLSWNITGQRKSYYVFPRLLLNSQVLAMANKPILKNLGEMIVAIMIQVTLSLLAALSRRICHPLEVFLPFVLYLLSL